MSPSRDAWSVRWDVKRQILHHLMPRVWAMKRRNKCLGKWLFIASFYEEGAGESQSINRKEENHLELFTCFLYSLLAAALTYSIFTVSSLHTSSLNFQFPLDK
ncbi:hypothetical protein L195_g046647, partial [Trifolium pratense]